MLSEFIARLRSDSEFRIGIVRTWGVALVVVALVAVVWTMQNAPVDDEVTLFETRELTADEIGTLQVAFAQEGLNDYEVIGFEIIVDRNLRSQFLSAAKIHNAVPKDLRVEEPESAFDMMRSRTQQHQINLENKRNRIRDLVLQFGFVQNAKAEYDEAQSNQMFGEVQKTATVTIQPVNSRFLEEFEIRAIVDTVKGAVAGIRASDIVVIDTNANRSFTVDNMSTGRRDQQLWQRSQSEEFRYRRKIDEATSAYPGLRVNVSVTFPSAFPNESSNAESGTDKPEQDGDGHSVESSHRLANSESSDDSKSNIAGSNQEATVPTTPRIRANTLDNATHLALVSVSIGVPENLIRRTIQYRQQNVSQNGIDLSQSVITDAEMESTFEAIRTDIRQKIAPLLPVINSLEDQIVITKDPEIPVVSSGIPAAETLTSNSSFWRENWKTLALIGFGFAALIVLSIRTGPTTSQTSGSDEEFLTPIDPATMETVTMPDSSYHIDDHQYLKQEIEQWCQSNPDEAVATIRDWLEKAG